MLTQLHINITHFLIKYATLYQSPGVPTLPVHLINMKACLCHCFRKMNKVYSKRTLKGVCMCVTASKRENVCQGKIPLNYFKNSHRRREQRCVCVCLCPTPLILLTW